jgi:hypothetical protein
MTATGCLLFVYVYERTIRLYGYFQRMLNHPYWMAGASKGGSISCWSSGALASSGA